MKKGDGQQVHDSCELIVLAPWKGFAMVNTLETKNKIKQTASPIVNADLQDVGSPLFFRF